MINETDKSALYSKVGAKGKNKKILLSLCNLVYLPLILYRFIYREIAYRLNVCHVEGEGEGGKKCIEIC
jgi:hypothetical protein